MPGHVDRLRGHVECLRLRRGDAAGTELDTDPVNRSTVNVGTVRGRPLWAGGTSADGCGWDGVSVVVRDRESRSHGEGRQRDCRRGIGMLGGRW